MDANQVASSHDAFDTLLDASSLGAPRVQAVRRHTPAAVRDLLASRLARRNLPAADAPGQSTPLPERGTEYTQPPLQHSSEEQELQHTPQGSNGSHHSMHIKSDSNKGGRVVFVSHSTSYECIPHQVNRLAEHFADLVKRISARTFQDSLLSCLREALEAEVSMETRLLTQPFFAEQESEYSRIGRYGMGAKLVLASAFIREEILNSGNSFRDLLGNGRFEHTDGKRRVRAGWAHAYGQNVLDESCWRRGTDAAHHGAAMAEARNAVLSGDLGHWLVLWPDASDHSVRGMSTQMGQGSAWATSRQLGTATAHRTQRRDPRWWPGIDADAEMHAWLAAVGLSGRGNQGSRPTFGRQRTNSEDDRRSWLDHFLAVYWPGAPARSNAVPETTWEQLVYGLPGRPAPGPHGCLTAHIYWCGMPGRIPVSAYPRPDDRMPALAPVLVLATRTAEILCTDLNEIFREKVALPLPMALELLFPAGGSTALTSRACHIEAMREATTAWEITRLILMGGNGRIVTPVTLASRRGDPCAAHAAFEEPSGEQIVCTFVRGLHVAEMQDSSGYGNARAGTADRKSGDQVDTCMDIRVNTAERGAVLQMKQKGLARILDSTRENIDNQNEHHRMPSARDAVSEEWLSDAHRH
ncbi:hypothetical protein [Streptomyces mirabilis]|uniref:hypothetical protein n=1 Tax=Streptomyces mirabilis TaxID=68239 RepID=UPI003329A3CA